MISVVNILVFLGVVLLLPTAYAAKIGAPYAPTFTAAIKKTFDFISLGEKDVVVDLGAGDGRVLLEAHQRGAKAIGYELSPFLWFIIWLRLLFFFWQRGVIYNFPPLRRGDAGGSHIQVYLRNFYKQKLPTDTTVIFAFLMPEHMNQVKDFLAKQHLPKARFMLVYSFPFKNVEPVQVIQTPKCGRMYIYDLPALVNHK